MLHHNKALKRNNIIMKTYRKPVTQTFEQIVENMVLCASQMKGTVEKSNVLPEGDY